MFHPYISEKAPPAVEKVIRSRWIGQGALVSEFEEKFIETAGVPFAAAVNSVSSAIRLALALARVGPGDEVITTPQTCTATNHSILEQFAVPVFADIQPLTGNIDPENIGKRITPRTKAVVCFHWGGYPCDLDSVHSQAGRHGLAVIEDASDALGARYRDIPIGSFSPYTCFSFAAVQQITTGEGGMLCTLSKNDDERAKRKRWYGIDRLRRTPNRVGYYDFDVSEAGYGYHMTNIAAAIGLANLEDFPSVLKRRKEIAGRYRSSLEGADGVTLLEAAPDRESAHQLFTILVERREDFCASLRSRGIETSIVHERNDVYSVFGGRRDDLPNLDRFSGRHISLPLHNQLSDEDVSAVLAAVKEGW